MKRIEASDGELTGKGEAIAGIGFAFGWLLIGYVILWLANWI